MTELKKSRTLKDIKNTEEATNRICSCGSIKESHGLEWIRESTLRKEAIKRVMNCCPKKIPDSLGASPTRCIACERDIWFNNLEGEDLK